MNNSITRLFLPAIILWSMLSCTNKDEIIITAFKEFPEEIKGCACYFSRTKEELYKGSYIFTDDNSEFGFISINGKMTKLDLVGYEEKDEKHWIKIFSNSQYEITVVSQQKWQVDQMWHQTSVITIKDKKGKIVTESIHAFGECGGC